VAGSASNDGVYTVEEGGITDANNVIVNEAHAGGTTTKSLTDETVAVTVTLVCKAKNAPLGYGQGWVNDGRSPDFFYTNTTGRSIMISINAKATAVSGYVLIQDENHIVDIDQTGGGNLYNVCVQMVVSDNHQYKYQLFLANRYAERALR